MPARTRLNALGERKQALLLEAGLHRRLITIERLQLAEQVASVRDHVAGHRWWWIGGAVLVGCIASRRAGGLLRWLPAATAVLRLVRGLRG